MSYIDHFILLVLEPCYYVLKLSAQKVNRPLHDVFLLRYAFSELQPFYSIQLNRYAGRLSKKVLPNGASLGTIDPKASCCTRSHAALSRPMIASSTRLNKQQQIPSFFHKKTND